MPRALTALPVYNEQSHVNGVLDQAAPYSQDVLVVDDGSTDATPQLLAARTDIVTVAHPHNRGYGAALMTAFRYAEQHGYDVLVTIDCDGQHQPQRIPDFVAAAERADIVSGSRYLKVFDGDSAPPVERRAINVQITAELNERLGYQLTDAFCGFKAYRVPQLKHLHVTENGYAMPLQLWVQAYQAGLSVIELPVPLIYLEEERSFGGALDNAETRLKYYREVLEQALAAPPPGAATGGKRCAPPSSGDSHLGPPHGAGDVCCGDRAG